MVKGFVFNGYKVMFVEWKNEWVSEYVDFGFLELGFNENRLMCLLKGLFGF